jgi:hypothetical protein
MKTLLKTLLFATLIFSCRQKETTEQVKNAEAFDLVRSVFFDKLYEPAEVAARIKATTAVFNSHLLSDPNHHVRYMQNEVKAAANLGIYLSDLNYCIAFGQSASTNTLFTAAHDLSEAIGIEKPVIGFLMDRYMKNLEQNDSARQVLNELFLHATNRLKGAEQEKLVGIAMAAYQIENLHLVLGTLTMYPKDNALADKYVDELEPFYRLVMDQQDYLVSTYNFLQAVADPLNPNKNPHLTFYASAYLDLIHIYQRLNVSGKLANNDIKGLMNDSVIQELQGHVETIRNKIISI